MAVAKIKGGRWTVARFFLVSVAYTAVWLAVSSQLAAYSAAHGPRVLLWLNAAFYAPSVPLLGAQALLDPWLEGALGPARLILARLSLGLAGAGALALGWPFLPPSLGALVAATAALGACSGLAFSASYQLVSRFANKSTLALGLGCVASGPLVLALELGLGFPAAGAAPARRQAVALFWALAGVVGAGLWATASLLVRHWAAIEGGGADGGGAAAPLLRRVSTPGSAGFSPRALLSRAALPRQPTFDMLDSAHGFLGAPAGADSDAASDDDGGAAAGATARASDFGFETDSDAGAAAPAGAASASGSEAGGGGAARRAPALAAARLAWPALVCVGVQAGSALTLFPLFTYIPSSGSLGARLPSTLFWTRVFADAAGRAAPRLRALAPARPGPPIALAAAVALAEAPFFWYLRAPAAWRSDAVAVAYVAAMWFANGLLNSVANILVPRLCAPAPHQRGTAAALMALTYQVAHFVGLAAAAAAAAAMFDGAGPGS
jgi:hypothetical protein